MSILTTAERTTLQLLLRSLNGDLPAIDSLFGVAGDGSGKPSTAERTAQQNLLRSLTGNAAAIDALFGVAGDGSANLSTAERSSLQTLLLALSGDALALDTLNLGYNPAAIPNLVLWMDGRTAAAFSDTAGTLPITAPTGRVRRIDQPSPLTGSWLAPSALVSAFRDSNALDFHAGTGLTISGPAGITLPADGTTLGFCWVNRDVVPGGVSDGIGPLFFGVDGTSTWGVSLNSTLFEVFSQGAQHFPATMPAQAVGVVNAAVVRFTPTGVDVSFSLGGVTGTASSAFAIPSSTVSSITLGALSTNQYHGGISQVTAHSRAISDPERATLLAGLLANAPAPFPVANPLIAHAGDSIARFFGASLRSKGYAYLALPNMYATAPVKYTNSAIVARTIAQVQAGYATEVAPFYSATRAKNILVAAMGVNSMSGAGGSLTGAQALTAYYAYCDQAKADGWKVVLCTILPNTAAGVIGGFETARGIFNTDLVANFASHGAALCDFAGVAGMGGATDSNGTNYLADHTHPNDAGNVLLAPVYQAAVLSQLP